MKQEFHGEVGHVAGRDIIYEAPQMLWDWETSELKHEFRRCKAKLWKVRFDIFFSAPSIWLAAGTLAMVWMLFSGIWFKVAEPLWLFAAPFGAVMIPSMWLLAVRQRKGKMVAHYRERIEIIDTILQDRE
ncbi:MAG: hypothetical protein FWF17_08395 [Betaproteobacteria bacterium]|nr:hypothetical protein [Betaproteobacteria bacterium]